MKLSIYHRGRTPSKAGEIPPGVTPDVRVADHIETDLSELRRKILDRILAAGALVSLLVYLLELPAYFDLARESRWGWLVLYSLICLGLLLVGFVRGIPYQARAVVFLVVLLVFGLMTIFASRSFGIGAVFLVALPIFAGILLGLTGRVSALVISVLALGVAGFVVDSRAAVIASNPMLNEGFLPGLSQAGLASGHPWLLASGLSILLTIALTLSVDALLREMENSLRRRQSMFQEAEGRRLHLENQTLQRTRDLERRLVQIRTAAEITSTISRGGVTVPLGKLLPQVCDLIRDRFDLYYVGIFLIEKGGKRLAAGEGSMLIGPTAGEYAHLVAGTGEAGEKMLAEDHKLEVGGESMVGWCTANRQARIALDVGQEAVRFDNPYLPETRSELALPIYSQEEALGALTIQSREESAFDNDDVVVLQGIADNLASAIVNARLFAESQASLDEIQSLHRQYLESAWTETLQAQGGELRYTFAPPERAARSTQIATSEGEVLSSPDQEETALPAERSVPMRTIELPIRLRDQIIGALTLEAELRSDAGAGGRRLSDWTSEEKAFIEAVMDQAALALENARLLDETRRRAEQERLAAGIAGKVWASRSVDNILRTALQELSASLGVTEGVIRLEVKE